MIKSKSSSIIAVALMSLATLILGGCNPEGQGFALPPGDVDAGRNTFVELGCNQCHRIVDDVQKLEAGHPEIDYTLGGGTTRVRTYGDLVTSIINPSHKIVSYANRAPNVTEEGESKMRNYNDVMTVQQLIDLTTFLQTTYKVVGPQYAPYYYGP